MMAASVASWAMTSKRFMGHECTPSWHDRKTVTPVFCRSPRRLDILKRLGFSNMIDRRLRDILVVGVVVAASGCARRPTGDGARKLATITPVPAAGGAPGAVAQRRPPRANPDALPPGPSDLPEERRAWQVVDGQWRLGDADAARAAGLTLVDLSDGWAPLIQADGKPADGAPLANRYRAIYVGLSNDKSDGDGQPLGPGERNYLELLGVPPSLSVMVTCFLEYD